VQDAKANTKYEIKVLSNGISYDHNGIPYVVQTPATTTINANGLGPAYGTVMAMDDTPAAGALVYLTLDGAQELSAITKPSGLWLIPLNQIRTQDLTNLLPTVERMTMQLTVLYGDQQASAVTDTLNDAPVPQMSIGKTYDFRHQQAKTTTNTALALQTTPQQTDALPVNTAILGESTAKTYTVSLTTPVAGAALTTTLPLVSGTGVPGAFVGISIGITKPISGSVKIPANGVWTFTPPKTIAPGKQSVTITTIDAGGKTVAFTHAFEIFKSGTQVLGDATPSATLAPTTTIATTPTPLATNTPASTLSGEPPPDTGSTLPVIILILLGLGLVTSGVAVGIR
jgi:hypothetical protein